MQIQWQNEKRIHVGCGGEGVIVPDGYICTHCGAHSYSDILSEEEEELLEREEQERYEREEQERVERYYDTERDE